ncbi:MAG: HD domain-containing protein [Thermogutta sp.]
MEDWYRIPELVAVDSQRHLVRIPPEVDVPLTERVCHLIDTPQFRRLSRISQLGLVSLVYPAANHTRFEHSLGVYRLALLFLKHLSHDRRFRDLVASRDAERLLVTALLHDVGHWPFCHPIEDMRLEGVPGHEAFLRSFLEESMLGDLLRKEWNIESDEVMELLNTPGDNPGLCLLHSILSGPIDIDKMDYLFRDSLHAGVPYGRFFDQQRLVASLCINAAGDGLAITEKGKTAAELMVFARYVMFSEVYWHHAVRSATAMFQRAFYEVYQELDPADVFRLTEWEFIAALRKVATGRPVFELVDGLFGERRRLYKRIVQYHFFHDREVYSKLAGRPYHWLVRCCSVLCDELSRKLGRKIDHHKLLLDAPPTHKEIEFRVDVFFPKEEIYRPLSEVSPVVRALAQEQFDHYVKRVRLFGAADIAGEIRSIPHLRDLILKAIEITETSSGDQ